MIKVVSFPFTPLRRREAPLAARVPKSTPWCSDQTRAPTSPNCLKARMLRVISRRPIAAHCVVADTIQTIGIMW